MTEPGRPEAPAQPDAGGNGLADPMDGAFMGPNLNEAVPDNAKERILGNVYAGAVEQGRMTAEQAQTAADESLRIITISTDEDLVAANRDASDALQDVADRGYMPEDGPESGLQEQDDDAAFEAYSDHYEATEEAVDAIGNALGSLPYVDPGRAEAVLGMALEDPELNGHGMLGVAKGLIGLTMMEGQGALPLWREARAGAQGDKDKQDTLDVAIWTTSMKLEEELKEVRQDPEADPAAIRMDEELLAELNGLATKERPRPRGQTAEKPAVADTLPAAPEKRRQEAARRFEENFDRSKLAGDPRWN